MERRSPSAWRFLPEVVQATSRRYLEAFRLLTGRELVVEP